MKHIFLSVVVIAALITAGVGGTFAHFSDTEESLDNVIQIGSMDLKVINKLTGVAYDDPLPTGLCISAIDIQPCESADFTWQLKNTGQPEGDICHVYMHVKNPRCENVTVIHTGEARPEPEVVAEDGGWLGQVYIPGIGPQGDTCNLLDYVEITVYYPWDQATSTGPIVFGPAPIGDIVCDNLLLGELNKCDVPQDVHAVVHFYDIPEAAFIDPSTGQPFDLFDETDPDIQEKSWDHWPTNAFMKDKVTFDILFSLVQG